MSYVSVYIIKYIININETLYSADFRGPLLSSSPTEPSVQPTDQMSLHSSTYMVQWFQRSNKSVFLCDLSTNCPLLKCTIPRLLKRIFRERKHHISFISSLQPLQPLQPQPPRKKADRSSAAGRWLGILSKTAWDSAVVSPPSALSLGQLRMTMFSLEDWKIGNYRCCHYQFKIV